MGVTITERPGFAARHFPRPDGRFDLGILNDRGYHLFRENLSWQRVKNNVQFEYDCYMDGQGRPQFRFLTVEHLLNKVADRWRFTFKDRVAFLEHLFRHGLNEPCNIPAANGLSTEGLLRGAGLWVGK